MLRILGKASSINVRKVLWTCEEVGLPYERRDEGPELAQNPNGLVPVIVDGDFVLWESNTILRYLAGRYGSTALLPRDPRRRAEVEQWIDWQATDLNSSWRYAFMALVRRDPAFDDPRQIAASTTNWNRLLSILDTRLATTQAFVAGADFTLADIPIGLSINRWLMTPIQRPILPAVLAYYECLSARPAFLKHGRSGIA
ncbi:glutathione S-transferase family protein [Reyranella sp.]|uniref:glutathione S-transferase family protein n=1 Tax=Reyranella sp. TaxID=1929291 RepID=UPI002730AC73|nr:glutathione S-transferase [Reyranella sp.]MDP2373885.1 glutathione S-transferase [Reyranella sp.]